MKTIEDRPPVLPGSADEISSGRPGSRLRQSTAQTFSGYRDAVCIASSRRSRIYTALNADGQSVIIKAAADSRFTDSLYHEYELSSVLNGSPYTSCVVEWLPSDAAIVMKQYGRLTLESFLGRDANKFDGSLKQTRLFVRIIRKVVQAVGEIHEKNIIHKDINPANIILDRSTGTVRIIDFSIATRFSRERQGFVDPGFLEGSLAYISPEQTGRTNRPIDFRSDFYSLGITMYEMFCGVLPFTGDALALVGQHIGRLPARPSHVDGRIAECISDVIMKLCAKEPGERYLGTIGILHDLEAIDKLLIDGRADAPFCVGRLDIPFRFAVSRRLYGREKEIQHLLDYFNRVSGGEKLAVMIKGVSGSGKSALVGELKSALTEKQAFFAAGKFDQFNRDVPYSAFVQGLDSLVRYLLSMPGQQLELYKERILTAVGRNGQAVINVLPVLEKVIGPQPELDAAPPRETRNRFKHTFEQFISVFASRQHPLVLFMDDLQWADSASLELIESVLNEPAMNSLLLLGTYRDNEVDEAHRLNAALNAVSKGSRIHGISLQNIKEEHVLQLVVDSFKSRPDYAAGLASLVFEKTGGNPFFINTFLKKLYESELINYNRHKGWVWDSDAIKREKITDNILDLVLEKINARPAAQVELLQAASCIGSEFHAGMLAALLDSEDDLKESLTTLEQDEIISYVDGTFFFNHDRIQQAVYNSIEVQQRERLHYRIGTYLNADRGRSDKNLVSLADHFMHGLSCITDDEKPAIAAMLSAAARKACSSGAYRAAHEYANCAVGLLDTDCWQRHYELTRDVMLARGTACSLVGNLETGEKVFREVIAMSRSKIERLNTCAMLVILLVQSGEPQRALQTGIRGLKDAGEGVGSSSVSVLLSILKAGQLMKKTGRQFEFNTISDFSALPPVESERVRATLQLLMNTAPAAYRTSPNTMISICMRLFGLTMKAGLSSASYFSFLGMGLIQGGVFKKYKEAEEWGELILKTVPDDAGSRGRAGFLASLFLFIWRRSSDECTAMVTKSAVYSVEAGDFEYACYSYSSKCLMTYTTGRKLPDAGGDPSAMLALSEKVNDTMNTWVARLHLEFCTLKKEGELFGPQGGAGWIKEMSEDKLYLVIGVSLAVARNYFYDNDSHTVTWRTSKWQKLAAEVFVSHPLYVFYLFFTVLAAARSEQGCGRLMKRTLKQFKVWAENCPDNFERQYLLLRAEHERLAGNMTKAVGFYRQSIESSVHYDAPMHAALAWELFGHCLQHDRQNAAARLAIHEAVHWYGLLGAEELHAYKKDSYRHLLNSVESEQQTAEARRFLSGLPLRADAAVHTSENTVQGKPARAEAGGTGLGEQQLDLNSILKANRAISMQINLDRLLETVMKTVLENAGAQKAFLVMSSDEPDQQGSLFVEASADSLSEKVRTEKTPLENAPGLSARIVEYAVRSGEHVVLSDACQNGAFTDDPHILAERVKSVLCAPVSVQGSVTGALYLENSYSENVFTPDRVEMLGMLSAQAAVSISNARLYSSLESRVKERTRQLQQSLSEVQNLKQQQDGDYFLTSLLTEPLNRNCTDSRVVKVSSLIKQKKDFKFKKYSREIGGDVCISGSVVLKDRRYVAFINGDAMGKSLQGAGGALVLGSVFSAILERNQFEQSSRSLSAPHWLKSAFLELHRVFLGFDGSMMMSVAMGLIDEESRCLFYINAEHPFTVLYRNKKAAFIEDESLIYRKLGTPGSFGLTEIKIRKRQLHPGDVLIAGSDGRDDLFEGHDDQGHRVINMDHTRFLNSVEESCADLSMLYGLLSKDGRLTDDLSLLKIEILQG